MKHERYPVRGPLDQVLQLAAIGELNELHRAKALGVQIDR